MKPNVQIKVGIRLTCPQCQDSSVFTQEEIDAAGGSIDCGNHPGWVTMVNLVELLAIWGKVSTPVEEEEVEVIEEVDFYA